MNNPEKILHGFLELSVSGDQLERFLNLCHARAVSLERIRYLSEKNITTRISINDFRKLLPIHRKTRVRIHILKKRGLPFLLLRIQKRKCFTAGFLLCVVLLLWLSGHIWNIHIDGNVKNSTPQLLEFLDQQGITHGIRKNQVNCTRIADLLRKNYPDITFVSPGFKVPFFLPFRRKPHRRYPANQLPCNLISNLDGKIVNMVIRNGTPLVKTGDICKQGDILVSGEVPILNDSQEVVRVEYVPADADIYVRHQIAYYQEVPLSYEKKVQSGTSKTSWYFRVGDFVFGADTGKKSRYITSTEEIPWKLTENFVLPFSLGKITRTPYKIQSTVYTKEQAQKKAVQQLRIYEQKLLNKGIRIADSRLSVTFDSTNCTVQGTLTVDEKSGKKQNIEFSQES